MNKKQKTEKCREILNLKYKINQKITDEEDIIFLLSIFENHSEWDIKKGVGIDSISIALTKFNNRTYILNRIDGSFDDISFTHCISGRSKIIDIKNACRSAIIDIKNKYKRDNVIFGISICPISNEILTKENIHIDHYDLTFNEMFNLWVKKHDIELLFSKINKTIDNSVDTFFTDESIIEDFINFHNENSKLRAVHKTANLSTLRILHKSKK